MPTTSERIKILESTVPMLNTTVQIVADKVKEIEGVFNAMGVGITMLVPVPPPERCSFGYGRIDGKFGFYLLDENYERVPFNSLSRALKVECFALMPKLMEAVVAEIDKIQHAAEKAIRDVGPIIEELKGRMDVNP